LSRAVVTTCQPLSSPMVTDPAGGITEYGYDAAHNLSLKPWAG
jgi:hypothetical protein